MPRASGDQIEFLSHEMQALDGRCVGRTATDPESEAPARSHGSLTSRRPHHSLARFPSPAPGSHSDLWNQGLRGLT